MQASLAAILGIVGLPILAGSGNVANAVETAMCKPAGNVFVGMANSDVFRLRKVNNPAAGINSWSYDEWIGTGWNERFMAGPNGYLWFIETDGELRRHRWTGTGWDNGGISQLIANNWGGWDLPQYHFRVTVDAKNHIYAAEASGELALYRYNETTNVLSRKVIATGWNKYDHVTAGGAGVLYARDPNVNGGTLYRFEYDADAETWKQQDKNVGFGWNGYKQITSPGGDILYGTWPGGETWWYRYLPKYDRWENSATGDWKYQITNWTGVDEIAPAIDNCRTGETATDVECATSARLWGSQADDNLYRRDHNEPEAGVTSWEKPTHVGSGWNGSRFMGGAKGYKFSIEPDGEFRVFRWIDGTGWENGGNSTVIATDWGGWHLPAYHNRVTVDSNNHVYAGLATGQLEFNVYDETTKTLTQKQIIDDGWNKYDQVFAAGDGVLYARDPNVAGGTLYRYHYDWKNRRWIDYARNVGNGWNGYRQLLSPGGDIVYAVWGTAIWWYRWDNTAKVFTNHAEGDYKKELAVWNDVNDIMVDVDACKLTNPDKITPPQTPAPGVDKAEMIYNAQKSRFELAFADENGSVKHYFQQVSNSESLQVNPLSSTGFTGRATLAQQEDDKIVVMARGTNAQTKAFVEPAANSGTFTWTQKDVKGALHTSPVLARGTNKVLTAFAVDGDNKLWYAEQFAVNGEFKPWRQATAPDTYTMTGEMTIVPSGDGFEIAYTDPTGAITVKKFAGGALGASRIAGGITGVGTPAAVVFSDGKVQLVARANDNKLYTLKEGASGFAGWTNISGALQFTGTPEALLNKFNVVEVVARDTNGWIHRGGQTEPGSATWRVWTNIGWDSQFDVSFAAGANNEQRIFADVGNGLYILAEAPPYASEPSLALSSDAATSLDKSSRKVPAKATKQKLDEK
ncbi:tachylectin-related carbohydrate-binding protein [Lentzea sp. NBRC 102530]|uniref:tachylectin-related carbohydrate-binding protein n=1 Tax=Lentzea sp. NBRC 102530 TaxID=3032201 RepID=UPI0024A54B1C|nr:tachylectin-related carbohydrate-binding protein [Lentzea sp. NBRC 102530]GLY50535.1 hypothetical protein Lesp01_41910 [Lentzea sp. NBRC 102530]